MLSALAVIFGLVGVIAVWRAGLGPADAIIVGLATAVSAVVCARLGLLGPASAWLSRLPGHIARTPARLRAKASGAFRAAAASISADVTIAPALIQTPLADQDPVRRGMAAAESGEAAGAMPVALREGYALVHVLDEDRFEARARASRPKGART